MVKILYGVAGEGMGHATRSWVVIKELMKKHKVKVVCGDNAYDFLSIKIKDIEKIRALRLMYLRNKVSNIKTIIYNIKHLKRGRRRSIKIVEDIIRDFKPDVVISDFEYFSSFLAKKHKLPLIVIDNNHITSKTKVSIPKRYVKDFLVSKLIANVITRKADYFFLTTFFYPPTKEKNVHLFPPILRKEILSLKPSIKDHILVYQISKPNIRLISTLKKIDENFIVYSIKDKARDHNIIYKKFNEKEFFNDLKDCKAVITNGGFSLIGEALYLNKPILSIPLGKQFEQIANALYLKKFGYGLFSKRISKHVFRKFLSNINMYRDNLNKYKKEGNSRLFNELEKTIAKLKTH
jgi:uncharacterized protein (TIGR00661 family)|tara:strand:+ start:483 stop:1532 length:1050 start_codon:yes stop_codon:yes gene_type:complete